MIMTMLRVMMPMIFWNAGGLGWSIGKLEYLEDGRHWHKSRFILNTLHNSKRLGPFLGFGFNFCGKQDEYLKTDKFGQTSYTLFGSIFGFWV